MIAMMTSRRCSKRSANMLAEALIRRIDELYKGEWAPDKKIPTQKDELGTYRSFIVNSHLIDDDRRLISDHLDKKGKWATFSDESQRDDEDRRETSPFTLVKIRPF